MNHRDLANAARRLKENPDFIAIMEQIENDIFKAFKSVNIGDTETLSNVHNLSHGYNCVIKKIDKYIEIDNFEKSKIEE